MVWSPYRFLVFCFITIGFHKYWKLSYNPILQISEWYKSSGTQKNDRGEKNKREKRNTARNSGYQAAVDPAASLWSNMHAGDKLAEKEENTKWDDISLVKFHWENYICTLKFQLHYWFFLSIVSHDWHLYITWSTKWFVPIPSLIFQGV